MGPGLLGAGLVGADRADLTRCLPKTYASVLPDPLQATESFPADRFIGAAAAPIKDVSHPTATGEGHPALSVPTPAWR